MLLFSYRGLELPLMILSQELNLDLSHLNYKHRIESLTFGELKRGRAVDRRFKQEGATFDRAQEISLGPNSGEMDYEYYLVVVPHIYKKKQSDRKPKLGYKYSLNYNMREPQKGEPSFLRIQYAFSPITMVSTLQGNSFMEFLIHLCAIIGGSFVILGIINRMLISAFTPKFQSTN